MLLGGGRLINKNYISEHGSEYLELADIS